MNNTLPIFRISKKECLDKYKIYEHPEFSKFKKNKLTKKNKKKLFSVNKLSDSEIFKKKYKKKPIYEGLEKEPYQLYEKYSPFINYFWRTKPIIVPKIYHEVKNIEIKQDCNEIPWNKKILKKIINLEKKGMCHQNWIENAKKYWLTIGDILKNDKTLLLLSLSENYIFHITSNKFNKLYNPEDFFKFKWVKFKKDKNLKGVIQEGHIIKKNMKSIPYTLNIKINDKWLKIKKDYVIINKKKVKWSTLPLDTYVGIDNGPLILWKNIKKLPQVYILEGDPD